MQCIPLLLYMHDIFVTHRRHLSYETMQKEKSFFKDILNLRVKVKRIMQEWVVVFQSLTSKIHPKVNS